jgi:hypothetical protein
VAERTLAATAELEMVATSKCERPQRADEMVVGRCHKCQVCKAHQKMLAQLDFLKWAHFRKRWPGDTVEDGAPPVVTVGQLEEVWNDGDTR